MSTCSVHLLNPRGVVASFRNVQKTHLQEASGVTFLRGCVSIITQNVTDT